MNAGKSTLESMSLALWYNQWTLSKFRKYLKGDILEIGFGIGNFTQELAKYGKIWAIDIEKDYIKSFKSANNIKVGLGNIESGKYFFSNLKFDSIVCLNVLEHIKEDELALKNIYKLLKPEGNLILLVPSNQFLYGAIDQSIGHYRRYQKLTLLEVLDKIGYLIKFNRQLNFLGGVGWFVSGKVFKDIVIEESKVKIFNRLAPLFLKLEEIIEPPFGTSILVIASKK